jgi:heme oxygenase
LHQHATPVRLIDLLDLETAPFHREVDNDLLENPVSPRGYQRYLARTYGFVAPIERSIITTPSIEQYTDLRRFTKEELLRRDLLALHYTTHQIDQLPQCSVPLFDTPAEALGWAYFIERSTLFHQALFRHVASCIPGDVAFASSYLKCYFGSVGEMWRGFADSLDMLVRDDEAARHQAIEGARTAFHFYQRWRKQTVTDRAATSGAVRLAQIAADDEIVS